ncbi:hypothetical protein GA0070616_0433 [Micromonospora nigra]|uniref:DUF2470 domain-containing protein n=1 Tax=Micromonospora nigra TaxID=145857 RepID=A0A1C6RBI2_9ACTN|nr:DUF2470 domain-containing protein [Micromonospora nigra]SCL14414.1 hypothetical protein GA0070616_0433 [Micromonospora nigra]
MAFHPAGRSADLADSAPTTDATVTTVASVVGADTVPTDADAVTLRSVLSATPSLRLRLGDTTVDLVDSHAVLPDGTVVLAVDAMSPTGGLLVATRGRPGAVRLDVTQLIPVTVRSRVRAKAWVRGTARRFDPGSLDYCDSDTILSLLDLPPVALWAVEPAEVGIVRDSHRLTVDIGAYRAARPDPLAADEAGHLQHLAQRHRDVVDRLAALVEPALTARSTRIAPVAVDADGIVLRAERPDGHTDVRLPFARRVARGADLVEGLRTLLAGATRH